MKKIIASILMLLYITASGGVVLNINYCMGKVSSIEINSFDDGNGCEKCGMAGLGSCCSSEFKVVKVDNVHKAAVVVSNYQLPVTNLPVNVSLIDISKLYSNKGDGPVAHASPGDVSPDLYVLHSILRI